MAVDFPRGWEISRATPREYHHNRCSYNTHGMLCDCDVVLKHPEYVDAECLYGADGIVLMQLPKEPAHG